MRALAGGRLGMAAVACAAMASSPACGGKSASSRDASGGGGIGLGGDTGGGATGSGGAAGLSVSGGVLGVPFVAADAAASTNGSPPAGMLPYLEVALTDVAGGACDELSGQRADSHVLRLYLFNGNDQTAIGPGTYHDSASAAGPFILAVWHVFGPADGGCADPSFITGSPATVILTEVSATRVVGSFDVTILGAGTDAGADDAGVGHLSGTFTAPLCPTPDGGPTCF